MDARLWESQFQLAPMRVSIFFPPNYGCSDQRVMIWNDDLFLMSSSVKAVLVGYLRCFSPKVQHSVYPQLDHPTELHNLSR